MHTGTTTHCCDKCSRPLEGKGWLEINGWKICGICQYESGQYLAGAIDNKG